MTKSPKIILAAGVLLISYLSLIIGTVHLSQQRVHEAVDEQLRLSLEKRATALSYFFHERKHDVIHLAAERSIESYFAGKTLGMSLEYGLQASLLGVEASMVQVSREERIGDKPIYERVTFVDSEGRIIADTLPEESRVPPTLPMRTLAGGEAVVCSHSEDGVPVIGVAAPVFFKGSVVGLLLGRIDVGLVLDQLVSGLADGSGGQFALIDLLPEPDLFLSDPGFGTKPPGFHGFQAANSAADGNIKTRPVTMVTPVAGTPFQLVATFPSDPLEELVTSPGLLAALAGVAVLVLMGLLYFLRLNNYSVALQARLQEGQRHEVVLALHNANLRTEIERRLEAERELIRTTEALQQTVGQLEKASLAKSDFLAKMSHELRTPLNAILGFSHCITTELFGPIAQRRYVEYGGYIHASGLHLLDIINDILDLAKVEAGRKELCETVVAVEEVLASCKRTIDAQARTKRIAVTLEAPPRLPGLRADARLLTQILLNLLSNAVKFTPEGGSVRLAAAVTAAGETVFTVADSGIGMHPDDVARALEPFSQIHPVMTTPVQGTGLGLSLVKKFAELHGAEMTIQTAPGAGTTVVVRFPSERTVG